MNKQLTEADVRRIIQDEALKNYRSGSPSVAPHTHDGNNNLQIKESDLIKSIKVNGTINMAQSTDYILKFGNAKLAPTAVSFIGGALTLAGSGKHAMVVGNAQLGVNQQFQPESTTSVIIGPVQTNIIQGSACILIDDANVNNTVIRNSQGHIVFVQDIASSIVAQADVISFTNSELRIRTTLASGWSISGLWTIT